MKTSFDELAKRLQPYYSHFEVDKRLLFSGHSHQAWPDVCLDGLIESFTTAAEMVDDKWGIVFEKVEKLRGYLRAFYDDEDGQYSFSESTHNLVTRWLSSFNLKEKPRIVTTDGEFHSINRQLTRLEEEGIEIVRVASLPLEGFADRFAEALDGKTAAALISHVYFSTSLINDEITVCANAAHEYDIPLLIDDYHGTNVIKTSIPKEGLDACYILIGGYKYLQWGEGNCFLRFPAGCSLRPVITGWFAAFETLTKKQSGNIPYDDGDNRFLGATFDGASQFRAAKVVDFFDEMELTPELLQQNYQSQIAYMRSHFLELDLDPEIIRLVHDYPTEKNGGFLALFSPLAEKICRGLKQKGVFTDFRNHILRMGPAPYVSSAQIDEAMQLLKKVAQSV